MSKQHFGVGTGVYTCQICGKRTRDTGGEYPNCLACFDYAGEENFHNDNGHSGKLWDCEE